MRLSIITRFYFLTIGLLIFVISASTQVPKMVIVEEFTNASCSPCGSQNPAFNELLKQNQEKVIGIKYQTEYPGYDPYNAQNNPDVLDRSALYEIFGVPTALIDGAVPDDTYGGGIGKWASEGWYPGAPGGFNQEVLDFAAGLETTIGISIEAVWEEDMSSADVYVHITNHGTEPIEGQFWVPLMLVEMENQWLFAPGTNGEKHFTQVMRRIYPENGLPLLNYLAPGASTTFNYEDIQIPSYIYDLKELAFVTFLQNPQSKKIYNGAITDTPEIPETFSDLAILEKRTVFSGDDCGKMALLGMQVKNSGNTVIHSATAVYTFGNETHRFDFEMNLNPGDTILIENSEPTILPSGAQEIAYSIENINGDSLREINLLNNLVFNDPFTAIAIRPIETFELGFEKDKAGSVITDQVKLVSHNNLFVRISEKNMFPNIETPIGGYGTSEKSVFANFRQWNIASFNKKGSVLFLDNADISAVSSVEITFDRAHAQRDKSGTLSNDGLEAWVSYDCGQNWILVYKKSGNDLATTNSMSDRFFPLPDQWETDTIILHDLTYETLMFKFELESDNGNSLFLDNFKIVSNMVPTKDIIGNISSMNLHPNPTQDQVYIDFELSKKTAVNLNIYSMEGKLLESVLMNESLDEGRYQYNWVPSHQGQFIVSLVEGNQVVNKMVSVLY